MDKKIEFNDTLKKIFASWIQEAKENGIFSIPESNDDIVTGTYLLAYDDWAKDEGIKDTEIYLWGEGFCEALGDEEDLYIAYLDDCYDAEEQVEWLVERGIKIEEREVAEGTNRRYCFFYQEEILYSVPAKYVAEYSEKGKSFFSSIEAKSEEEAKSDLEKFLSSLKDKELENIDIYLSYTYEGVDFDDYVSIPVQYLVENEFLARLDSTGSYKAFYTSYGIEKYFSFMEVEVDGVHYQDGRDFNKEGIFFNDYDESFSSVTKEEFLKEFMD